MARTGRPPRKRPPSSTWANDPHKQIKHRRGQPLEPAAAAPDDPILAPLGTLVSTIAAMGGTVRGACAIFSSSPINCPLCGVLVPANTPHTCKRDR
jgi:hypothetical protein